MHSSLTSGKGQEPPARPPDLTFDDLAELEPRLRDLESDILDARQHTTYWKDRYRSWYWNYKLQLRGLVGWASGYPRDHVLGTSTAWDTAYQHLVRLLLRRGATRRKRRTAG